MDIDDNGNDVDALKYQFLSFLTEDDEDPLNQRTFFYKLTTAFAKKRRLADDEQCKKEVESDGQEKRARVGD